MDPKLTDPNVAEDEPPTVEIIEDAPSSYREWKEAAD
jgi:hypothetical protein